MAGNKSLKSNVVVATTQRTSGAPILRKRFDQLDTVAGPLKANFPLRIALTAAANPCRRFR